MYMCVCVCVCEFICVGSRAVLKLHHSWQASKIHKDYQFANLISTLLTIPRAAGPTDRLRRWMVDETSCVQGW